jgi:hypothetical protein
MLIVAFAIALLVGALCATAAALAYNWMMPTYVTALTVPIVNAAGLVAALLAVLVLLAAYWGGQKTPFSKGSIAFGLACVVGLALLFPLADSGRLTLLQ